MAGRVIVAAILAAVVMFLWGFVFWGMGVATALDMMGPLPGNNDGSAGANLNQLVGEKGTTGVYIYPWPADPNDEATVTRFTDQHKAGPIVQVFYRKEGSQPMSPATFAMGWLHYFVLALLAGIVLKMALPALPSFGQRVCVVSIIGLTGAIWSTIAGAIWFSHPWQYAIGDAIYGIVAGLLMAVILAAIIKPRAGTA